MWQDRKEMSWRAGLSAALAAASGFGYYWATIADEFEEDGTDTGPPAVTTSEAANNGAIKAAEESLGWSTRARKSFGSWVLTQNT